MNRFALRSQWPMGSDGIDAWIQWADDVTARLERLEAVLAELLAALLAFTELEALGASPQEPK